jgi:hypothetical protein
MAPINILSSFMTYLISHAQRDDVPGNGTRCPAKAYKFHFLS